MKKLVFFLLISFCIAMLAGCSLKEGDPSPFKENNEALADKTFSLIIDAVKSKNHLNIKALFSKSIQDKKDDLEEEALEFIKCIQGEVLSYSSAFEAGTGASYTMEKGKMHKEIQPCFSLNTTESVYYIAIKECVRDDFDSNNVGVLSVYIIEAKNWKEDYIYRGDGKWTEGITIVKTPQ